METKPCSFESSFDRLEKLLEEINSGSLSLDGSLKVYEEANALIKFCQSELSQAEQRVEVLLKDREAKVQVNEKQEILSKNFIEKSNES